MAVNEQNVLTMKLRAEWARSIQIWDLAKLNIRNPQPKFEVLDPINQVELMLTIRM